MKIAFIGYGNMANALVSSILTSKNITLSSDIHIFHNKNKDAYETANHIAMNGPTARKSSPFSGSRPKAGASPAMVVPSPLFTNRISMMKRPRTPPQYPMAAPSPDILPTSFVDPRLGKIAFTKINMNSAAIKARLKQSRIK